MYFAAFSNFSDIKSGDNVNNVNGWFTVVTDVQNKKAEQVRVTLKRADMHLFEPGKLLVCKTFIQKDNSLAISSIYSTNADGTAKDELYKLGSINNLTAEDVLSLLPKVPAPLPV
jgi:hypothetical protein